MNEVNLDVVNTVRFKLGGKFWDVSKPTMGQAKTLQIKLEQKTVNETDLMSDFLGELGLPKDVFEALTIEQMGIVTESLLPSKKN